MDISSIPQHAVANGIGQRLDRRAQLMTRLTCDVKMPSVGIAVSRPMPMPLKEIVASRTLGIIEATLTSGHKPTAYIDGHHPGSSKSIGMPPGHIA